MNREMMEGIREGIRGFRLPRYEQIPSVGLYLEQTVQYINECLAAVNQEEITGSMISNYVKRGLLDNPVKKQYSREQIAYLIFIALAKNVLSMENLRLMISVQRKTYTPQRAYDYLCSEFENLLEYVFGIKESIDTVGVDHTEEKIMLRSAIVTVAHKVYLDKLFDAMQQESKEKA